MILMAWFGKFCGSGAVARSGDALASASKKPITANAARNPGKRSSISRSTFPAAGAAR